MGSYSRRTFPLILKFCIPTSSCGPRAQLTRNLILRLADCRCIEQTRYLFVNLDARCAIVAAICEFNDANMLVYRLSFIGLQYSFDTTRALSIHLIR